MARFLISFLMLKVCLLKTSWAGCGSKIDLIHTGQEYSFEVHLNIETCYFDLIPNPNDKIVMIEANMTCRSVNCGKWNNTVSCFYSPRSIPLYDDMADCMRDRESCPTLRRIPWPPSLRTKTTQSIILRVKYWINTCENTPQFNPPPGVSSRADTSTTSSSPSATTSITPVTITETPAKTTKTPAKPAGSGKSAFSKENEEKVVMWLKESRERAQRFRSSTIALGVVSGILLLCICVVLIIYATSRRKREEPIRLIRGPFEDG